VHEQVEPIVEEPPHVRVKVDPADALGMRRGSYVVSKDKGSWKSIEENVLYVEKLRA